MVAVEAHKSKMTQAREESLHGLVARLDIPVSDISILDCALHIHLMRMNINQSILITISD